MTRPTGFTLKVRALIIERASGMCEVCGEAKPGMQVHHRRPRQAGGSRRADTNQASNGLYVCGLFEGCHDRIESERADAYKLGLLLKQHQTPSEAPVFLHGHWVLLSDDGLYIPTEGAA